MQEAQLQAEYEKQEKEQAFGSNSELLKKIIQMSLNKVTLMKKLEAKDGIIQKEQSETAENEAIKHFALFNVLGGQREQTVGGIPWSSLQIKRKDKNFNHL